MRIMGTFVFWLLYPFLAWYLSKDARTRVIVLHQGKVLLVKTWLGYGGWELPGGGLHKSELPAHGALRELAEETGIRLPETQLDHVLDSIFASGLIRHDVHYFKVKLDSDPTLHLQRLEIAEAKWYSVDEIRSLKIYAKHKQVIQDVMTHS